MTIYSNWLLHRLVGAHGSDVGARYPSYVVTNHKSHRVSSRKTKELLQKLIKIA